MEAKENIQAWKKFRYCPAIPGVPRSEWTRQGRLNANCFPAIGRVEIPKGSKMRELSNVIMSDQLILLPNTLRQTRGKGFNLPLSEENGIISDIYDDCFYYHYGFIVKPNKSFNISKFSGGLHSYRRVHHAMMYTSDRA